MTAPKDNKTKKVSSNAYLKYSGMAFQFFVIMFVAAFGGQKLDEWLELSTPIFTISLILLFSVAYFVKLYYDLMK